MTDGYWIFYEGPTYTQRDHADYWKWFSWANQAIADQRFEAQHEPRETPEDWSLALFDREGDRPTLLPPKITGTPVKYPLVRLRRENLLLVACEAGREVRVTLRNQPVARYQSLLAWDLRTPHMEKVASGTIGHGESGTVVFTPNTDGIYLLGASAGSCAYSVSESNAPVGLYCGEWLSLIHGADSLFFRLPSEVKGFAVSARGWRGETVRVEIHAPSGQIAASGETSTTDPNLQVDVDAGPHPAGVWSIRAAEASEGVLEDNRLRLDPKLAPVLSLLPDEVFGMRR